MHWVASREMFSVTLTSGKLGTSQRSAEVVADAFLHDMVSRQPETAICSSLLDKRLAALYMYI